MARRPKGDPDMDTAAFIGMIRQYLYENGMQQNELASAAGVGEEALSRLLSDKTRRPEPETVVGLARAMNKPVWAVAVAAGYPFLTPDTPSADDERLLRLLQSDPGIREVIEKYWNETSPEKRESLIRLGLAVLEHDRPKSDQSSE